MNDFRELKKYLEFFSGRVIKIYRCFEDDKFYGPHYWVAKYSLPDGEMTCTGKIYTCATDAIEAAQKIVALEVEQEYLTKRLEEFVTSLEAQGYSIQEIINALVEFSSPKSKWEMEKGGERVTW